MAHPTLTDKMKAKFNPHYLYPGQHCQNMGEITVGIMHKVLSGKSYWQVMDYPKIKRGSLLKFLGTAKQLKIEGDVDPLSSVFELVTAVSDQTVSSGDTVSVNQSDRQFILPAPEPPAHN